MVLPPTQDHTRKRRRSPRQGFLFPLAVLAALSLAFLVVYILQMSSGYSTQVQHVNETGRALALAESVLAKVLGRLREAPFSQRFFSPTPFAETGVEMHGGTYDLFVADTPGRVDTFDVFVRVSFGRVRPLYVWRVQHQRSILNAAGKMSQILFDDLGNIPVPTAVPSSPLAEVENRLAQRAANATRAAELAAILAPVTTAADSLSVLGGNPGGSPIPTLEPPTPLPPPPAPAPVSPVPTASPTVPPEPTAVPVPTSPPVPGAIFATPVIGKISNFWGACESGNTTAAINWLNSGAFDNDIRDAIGTANQATWPTQRNNVVLYLAWYFRYDRDGKEFDSGIPLDHEAMALAEAVAARMDGILR